VPSLGHFGELWPTLGHGARRLIAFSSGRATLLTMGSTSPLLTIFDAACVLRLPARRVKKLAKAGELPAVILPGDEVRFDEAELRAWIQNRKRPAAEGRS